MDYRLDTPANVNQDVERPRPRKCRWFHLPGCNHAALDALAETYVSATRHRRDPRI